MNVALPGLSVPKAPAKTRKIEVAFIAHFYPKRGYDEGPRRVYLCGLHGENRRVIPGAASLWPVEWKDAYHVAWLTSSAPESPNADLEQIYDLRTGKTMTVHAGKDGRLPDELLTHEPTFAQDPNTVVTSLDKSHLDQVRFGSRGNTFVLRHSGHTKTLPIQPEDWNGILFDKENNRVWLWTRGHISGSGSWNALYRLNWLTGKVIKVFDNMDDYDFSPHRALYAAADNFHLPEWARTRWPQLARAWVGNWQTGRKWPIVGRKVDVTSIAIRPNKHS